MKGLSLDETRAPRAAQGGSGLAIAVLAAEERAQALEPERLHRVDIDPRLQAHRAIRVFAVAGDRDEPQRPGADRLAKFSRQLVAIHYGQADVDQGNGRLEAGRDGEGARSVKRHLHLVSEEP